MRADDAVDLAGLEALDDLLRFLVGEEAAEHLDTNGVAGEAIGERVAVLGGQQRGGRQHGHLLAVLDGLERGADGHLGLAEAHVAAHQAVHRKGAFHVDLDVVDGLALVGGLDERERLLHLVLPRGVVAEGVAGGVDPLLIEHHQFLSDLAHGAAHLALRLGEVAAAQPVQHRRLAAHVLAEGVDLIAGHVQLVAALVLQEQVVALGAADGALDHALVLADAVLVVHHVVAGFEILEQAGALALARARLAVGAAPAGEVGLGDDGQLGGGHAAAAVQGCRGDVPAGFGEVGVGADGREAQTAVEQQAAHPLGGTLSVGRDHDPEAIGEQLAQAVGEAFAVAHHRPPTARVHHRRIGVLGCVADGPHRLAARQQAVGVGVQPGECLGGVAGPGAGQGAGQVVLLGQQVVGPVAHAPRLDEGDLGGGRQHVGDQLGAPCRRVVDQPRQPALHAVEQSAFGEALPLLSSPRLGGHEGSSAGAHLLGGNELAGGEDERLVQVERAALVVDRELGEPIDLVAPQVDADGCVGGGRKDVDDGAALGDLAAVLDELLTAVAEVDEPGHHGVGVEDGTLGHVDGVDFGGARPQPLQQCAHTGDHDGRAAFGCPQAPEHLHAVPHGLDTGADAFERQRLPGREQHHLAGGHVLHEIVVQLAGVGAGGARDDQRALVAQLSQGGNGQRPGRFRDRDEAARVAQGLGERRFVAEQPGERGERHGATQGIATIEYREAGRLSGGAGMMSPCPDVWPPRFSPCCWWPPAAPARPTPLAATAHRRPRRWERPSRWRPYPTPPTTWPPI